MSALPFKSLLMRSVELLNVQSLAIAGMDLPFQTKVFIRPAREKVRHLVKPIMFVALVFAFAPGDDET